MSDVDYAKRTLQLLEDIIRSAGERIIAAAEALAEVKEHRLYRTAGFSSFDRYCSERFGFSRSRAYQLVDFALIRRQIPVENESEARRIAPTWRQDPDLVVEAFNALAGQTTKRAAVRELTRTFHPPHVPGRAETISGSVWVVVAIPVGQQPPAVRVAANSDVAVVIRNELEASAAYRKAIVVRRDVELEESRAEVAS